jgi:DnaJ-class molecular chaperone
MPKSDKELADELDAQDRLLARGYERETCEKCGGRGLEGFDVACSRCEGRGYYWRAPITK